MKKILACLIMWSAILPASTLAQQHRIPDLCEYATSDLPNVCVRTQSFVTYPEKSNQDSGGSFARTSTEAYNVVEGKLYETDAFANASITTGKLGVAVSGNEGAYTQASATMRDTLSFDLKDYDFVRFRAAIHGIAYSEQSGQVDLGYTLRFSSARYEQVFGNQFYISSKDGESTENFWTSTNYDVQGFRESDDLYIIEGNLRLLPGLSTFDLSSTMASFVAGPGYGAFGNTASLTFELPEGATLKSKSGLFLTQLVAAPVPEPSTWVMILLGFGLIAGAVRFPRKSDAASYA